MEDFSLLRSATFKWQQSQARELKVWVHLVTLEGNSQRLPARLQVRTGATTREIGADDFNAHMLFPLDPQSNLPCEVQIEFS